MEGHSRDAVGWGAGTPWPRAVMTPIVVSTFQDCLEGGYTIRVDCHACGRGLSFNLGAMIDAGRRQETYIRPRWRCSVCGGEGSIRVSPPPHEPALKFKCEVSGKELRRAS